VGVRVEGLSPWDGAGMMRMGGGGGRGGGGGGGGGVARCRGREGRTMDDECSGCLRGKWGQDVSRNEQDQGAVAPRVSLMMVTVLNGVQYYLPARQARLTATQSREVKPRQRQRVVSLLCFDFSLSLTNN
jgi:hypothetical protein